MVHGVLLSYPYSGGQCDGHVFYYRIHTVGVSVMDMVFYYRIHTAGVSVDLS